MTAPILQSEKPVIFVGAGEFTPDRLTEALTYSGKIVAADGGARHVIGFGRIPDAVIGDFDSFPYEFREKIPDDRLFAISEQETTDFEKCLIRVAAPLILGLGFTGKRLDHGLAVLSAITRHHDRRCVLLDDREILFHCPGNLVLNLPVGTRFSLFPMRPVRGQSQGLEWPIDGLDFEPWGRVGTSNRVSEATVTLAFDGPGMIAILPRKHLDQVVSALIG